MKKIIYILIAIAIVLSVFNATKLDCDNLFDGDSLIAAISIVAATCAIVILLILRMSLIIKEKKKK